MRAAFVVPGPSGGRLEIREVEAPKVAPGRVLVRVRASGLNRGEVLYKHAALKGAPYIGGVEFAGEVTALGDGVSGLSVGQRVMGHGAATQADYVLVEPRALMPVAENLSWAEAAAFPNVFITAHDAIVTAGSFKAGEAVLINAAASGIGIAAVQIARALGAKAIIGTSRNRAKLDKVKPLGLTHAVAADEPLGSAVKAATGDRGVDLVIDTVGGPTLAETLKVMAMNGRLVNIGRMGGRIGELDMERLSFFGLKLIGVSFRARSREQTLDCIQACARDLLPHLASGAIKVPIARTFALAEIAAAHDFAEKDSHVGKIVLTFD
jgi:NADPH2:quinone reductase